MIPAHFIEPIVQLIERRIRSRVWLYWPPGPMISQVFDREHCRADISQMIETIFKEKDHDQHNRESTDSKS